MRLQRGRGDPSHQQHTREHQNRITEEGGLGNRVYFQVHASLTWGTPGATMNYGKKQAGVREVSLTTCSGSLVHLVVLQLVVMVSVLIVSVWGSRLWCFGLFFVGGSLVTVLLFGLLMMVLEVFVVV